MDVTIHIPAEFADAVKVSDDCFVIVTRGDLYSTETLSGRRRPEPVLDVME